MVKNLKRFQIQLSCQRKVKHKKVGYPQTEETGT